MNRQQAKELLPIIKAFVEGKTLEYRKGYGKWIETTNPSFSEYSTEYRVKSEPIYRPFENKEECYNEMLKHQPFGWLKSERLIYNIISINADGIIIHNSISNGGYSFKSAFSLTFVDGTPFGIKVEE